MEDREAIKKYQRFLTKIKIILLGATIAMKLVIVRRNVLSQDKYQTEYDP